MLLIIKMLLLHNARSSKPARRLVNDAPKFWQLERTDTDSKNYIKSKSKGSSLAKNKLGVFMM